MVKFQQKPVVWIHDEIIKIEEKDVRVVYLTESLTARLHRFSFGKSGG